MFKLIELSEGQEKSYLITEDCLLFGDGVSHPVSFAYPGRGLKPEHLKIFREGKNYFVVNLANDPFVTLNGLPFYKKKLDPDSLLKIRQLEFRWVSSHIATEEENDAEKQANKEAEKLEIMKEAEKPIYKKEAEKPIYKKEAEKPVYKKEAEKPVYKKEAEKPVYKKEAEKPIYKKEAEKPVYKKEAEKPYTPPPLLTSFTDLEEEEEDDIVTIPLKKSKEPKRSLKDDYSFDKPHEKDKKGFSLQSFARFKIFRWLSILTLFVLIFCAIYGVDTYLRLSEQSVNEEMRAAESLSDIAMALTYAQLHHISPQKHNWSEPEFIQNNLLATLPTTSSSDLKLDLQGQFKHTPYILRVHTSNDLSRFLLIANPVPSLVQWLIPKNSIIVDSSTMELRKLEDLKSLNRMLANLNSLDGIHVGQISELVKKGTLIPLSLLAKATGNPEFQPPRAIAFLRPGSENIIYNSPRYYPFADQILQKAIHFSELHTSSHELQMLKAELEVLKKMPNLVLYSSNGPDEAREAMRGLKAIQPDTKYIMGYLKYDSEGKFRNAQIIMDGDIKEIQKVTLPYVTESHTFPITPEQETVAIPYEEEIIAVVEEPKPELKSPLEHAVKRILNDRESALKPHKKEAKDSFEQYLETELEADLAHFINSLNLLKTKEKEEKRKSEAELALLLFEFDGLTLEDLNKMIVAAGYPFLVEDDAPLPYKITTFNLYNPEKIPNPIHPHDLLPAPLSQNGEPK